MARAQRISSLRFYAFVFVGLVVVGLNMAGALETAPSTKTSATIPVLPSTMIPATEYGHFNVSNCILLDISCYVSVDLHVEKEVHTVTYDLPLNASVSGSCSKMPSITLAWTHEGTTHLSLTMTFKATEDDKWKTTGLGFTAKADNQSSLITNGTEKEVNAWQNDTSKLKMAARRGKSFKCDQKQDITLQGNITVTVTIKKIQLQPFDGERGTSFGEADVCFASSGGKLAEPVDTIVPTAVGCVLAGLVVILIITYFVGRCKRPGYQKM